MSKGILIALGIFGLILVAGLLLLRYDLKRASESGPRWKRRLVAAGIIVLAAVGLVSYSLYDKDENGTAVGVTTTTGANKANVTGVSTETDTKIEIANQSDIAPPTEWERMRKMQGGDPTLDTGVTWKCYMLQVSDCVPEKNLDRVLERLNLLKKNVDSGDTSTPVNIEVLNGIEKELDGILSNTLPEAINDSENAKVMEARGKIESIKSQLKPAEKQK
jgi:HAMP domain-containing protein